MAEPDTKKGGELDEQVRKTPALKVFLLFAMLGMTALFIPLVIYYFLSSEGNTINLPNIFTLNSFLIILSSLVLEKGHRYFEKDQYQHFRMALGGTLLLGLGFLIGQYYGWKQLTNEGILLSGHPHESIFYVISGLHALHLIGGLIFLMVVFAEALQRFSYVETFINYLNLNKQLRLQLLRIYWHFLDILWIGLFTCFLF